MRHTGARIGIAAMTALLARRTQAHQAVLVSHLTPDNFRRVARLALCCAPLVRLFQRVKARPAPTLPAVSRGRVGLIGSVASSPRPRPFGAFLTKLGGRRKTS